MVEEPQQASRKEYGKVVTEVNRLLHPTIQRLLSNSQKDKKKQAREKLVSLLLKQAQAELDPNLTFTTEESREWDDLINLPSSSTSSQENLEIDVYASRPVKPFVPMKLSSSHMHGNKSETYLIVDGDESPCTSRPMSAVRMSTAMIPTSTPPARIGTSGSYLVEVGSQGAKILKKLAQVERAVMVRVDCEEVLKVVGFVTLLMMEKDNLKVAAKIICLHPDLFESLHSLAYSFNEQTIYHNISMLSKRLQGITSRLEKIELQLKVVTTLQIITLVGVVALLLRKA